MVSFYSGVCSIKNYFHFHSLVESTIISIKRVLYQAMFIHNKFDGASTTNKYSVGLQQISVLSIQMFGVLTNKYSESFLKYKILRE